MAVIEKKSFRFPWTFVSIVLPVTDFSEKNVI